MRSHRHDDRMCRVRVWASTPLDPCDYRRQREWDTPRVESSRQHCTWHDVDLDALASSVTAFDTCDDCGSTSPDVTRGLCPHCRAEHQQERTVAADRAIARLRVIERLAWRTLAVLIVAAVGVTMQLAVTLGGLPLWLALVPVCGALVLGYVLWRIVP